MMYDICIASDRWFECPKSQGPVKTEVSWGLQADACSPLVDFDGFPKRFSAPPGILSTVGGVPSRLQL